MNSTVEIIAIDEYMDVISHIDLRKISNRKISVAEFDKFCISFFRDGRSKYLRFGQAFLNEKYPTDVNPKLFYCEWLDEAIKLIHKDYIEAL